MFPSGLPPILSTKIEAPLWMLYQGSWQSPLGLSQALPATCMIPCSPRAPTAERLHPDSCIPIDINKAVGTEDGGSHRVSRCSPIARETLTRTILTVVRGGSISKDALVLQTTSKDLGVGRRVSDRDEILGLDRGRVPTTAAVEPTVEPPGGTIRVISRGLVSTAAIKDGAMYMSGQRLVAFVSDFKFNTHGPSA